MPESRSILIVDDEPDTRETVADILNDLGYAADTAADGDAALELVRRKPYDVALLDFRMPGMDGVTLYREIRRLRPETTGILVSAWTAEDVADEALASGIHRIMPKPVDVASLMTEVDRLLQRPLALVVDDDADFTDSIRDILETWGYRVGIAGDEASTHDLLSVRQPGVVLLDLKLDEASDPARIFAAIRRSCGTARIVLVTGFRSETEDIISQLLENGADAVCFKPLDISDLLATIGRMA